MSDQIVTEQVQQVSADDAFAFFGVANDVTPEILLTEYHKEWLKSETPENVVDIKEIAMRHLVSGQMLKQRYFEIVSPFANSCVHCKGAGEIFKFDRKPVKVNCHICAGKKKVTVKCRSCDGTGRYTRKFPEGGGINVSCRTCKGEGKVRVKCSNCRGKGKIKKIVPAHTIKSTTPCKHCGRKGFTDNHPMKKKARAYTAPIDNPVLSPEAAKSLSDMIQSAETE